MLTIDELLGQAKRDYFEDTNAHTVPSPYVSWYAVKALGAVTINTMTVQRVFTDPSETPVTALTSVTLVAGELFMIDFSAITLTSGKVVCYRKPRQ